MNIVDALLIIPDQFVNFKFIGSTTIYNRKILIDTFGNSNFDVLYLENRNQWIILREHNGQMIPFALSYE